MDFATRAYNHSFKMDPIVRSLLDTDFYKLLMAQYIQARHWNDQVSFALTNRTKTVRLGEIVDIKELRAQLDHVRTLRFTPKELIWLRGQTFYGEEGIFKKPFIDALARLQLPEYELRVDEETGQFVFETHGRWFETTWWEIPLLAIVNEMRNRTVMRSMGRSALTVTYARATTKLYSKLERLAEIEDLAVTDFGTRRRHGFLWQRWCVQMAKEVLGTRRFSGTSNALIAMEEDLEAKGTNAHEMPMALAAMAAKDGDEAIRQAPYEFMKHWQNVYKGNLLVGLPDTFGTSGFLEHAPQWLANWKGMRPDSKDPYEGIEELMAWWKANGVVDLTKKLALAADGLDVEIPGHRPLGNDIPSIHERFNGRVGIAFGWGTSFTNDFVDCPPGDPTLLKPLSLVCKVKSANGHPAVKLSDNYEKATGDAAEVDRYRRIFGTRGMANVPVRV